MVYKTKRRKGFKITEYPRNTVYHFKHGDSDYEVITDIVSGGFHDTVYLINSKKVKTKVGESSRLNDGKPITLEKLVIIKERLLNKHTNKK